MKTSPLVAENPQKSELTGFSLREAVSQGGIGVISAVALPHIAGFMFKSSIKRAQSKKVKKKEPLHCVGD